MANQNGDTNGLFRNDGGHFVDVAREWGVEAPRRSAEFGGVGAAVADFDGDGLFDVFVANYGPSALYRNDGGRRFVDVTQSAGLLFEQHATTPSWGDYDNDGRPDLYVAGFLVNVTHYPDHLFHNGGSSAHPRFEEVLPALVNEHDASHGVQWVDFDGDGALDLALANNDPGGRALPVPEPAAAGAGAAVAGDRCRRRERPSHEAGRGGPRLRGGHAPADLVGPGRYRRWLLLAERHAGARRHRRRARVDIEVTTMSARGRQTMKRPGVDPKTASRPLVVPVP